MADLNDFSDLALDVARSRLIPPPPAAVPPPAAPQPTTALVYGAPVVTGSPKPTTPGPTQPAPSILSDKRVWIAGGVVLGILVLIAVVARS